MKDKTFGPVSPTLILTTLLLLGTSLRWNFLIKFDPNQPMLQNKILLERVCLVNNLETNISPTNQSFQCCPSIPQATFFIVRNVPQFCGDNRLTHESKAMRQPQLGCLKYCWTKRRLLRLPTNLLVKNVEQNLPMI